MNKKQENIIYNLIDEAFNLAIKSSDLMIDDMEEIKSFYPRLVSAGSQDLKSDAAITTFVIAKSVKKDPKTISEILFKNMNDVIKSSENFNIISEIKITGPYINIWFDKLKIEELYLDSNLEFEDNSDKKVLIDYSSPNIAKQFHIGHLKTTVVGNFLYRLYKKLGYHVIGINHLGDYGTQFGKLIEGYKRWKDDYDLSNNPISDLNDIYIRINNLCKNDESVLEKCRDNFKKLESGDKESVEIWTKFKELSLKEFNKIYDALGVTFDSYKGESFYSDKMGEVIVLLNSKGLLKDSEGAKVVDLESFGLGTVLIQKENGSSIYITRDMAALLYRARTYDYYKNIYVVASEQTLHFKQLFKIMELAGLDEKYIKGAKHVPYGMINLPSGKMSTRLGNVIKIEDLINEGISRVKDKMKSKDNLTEEEIDKVSKDIAIGAIKFSNLSNRLIKDQTFVWDNVLDFNGDTGPYIQYVNVRINSILKEYKEKFKEEYKEVISKGNKELFVELKNTEVSKEILLSDEAYELFVKLSEFKKTLLVSAEKYEPYIITNYLIELSKAFNRYYNLNKILSDDSDIRKVGILICGLTSDVISEAMNVLGIDLPEKM